MKDHNLVEPLSPIEILLERRPARDRDGTSVAGLHNVWITLNNPRELNSYTTTSIKEVILALREASNDRAAVAVVITGAGTQAFCTGGNTREYAEIYAGAPGEYRQYMRLFNDMVSAVLGCDKPVICRVNGMRVGGGQEIGMACDFSVASDLAVFGQAGPRHGSAPDGGSTDFLPLFVGIEHAMLSATLCEPWSAHRFYRLGGLTQIVPALKVDGKYMSNPLVVTDREYDEFGRMVFGDWKTGEAREAGKALMSRGTIDLSLLDEAVEGLCTKLLHTMPDCLTKTVESVQETQTGTLGPQPRNQPRLVGAEHDDGGQRRFSRFPLRHPAATRGGLRPVAPASGGRRALERGVDRRNCALGSSGNDKGRNDEQPETLLRTRWPSRPRRVGCAQGQHRRPGHDGSFGRGLRRPAESTTAQGDDSHRGRPAFQFWRQRTGAPARACQDHAAAVQRDCLGKCWNCRRSPLAAVRGQCLGGGFELALACDFIVAEEGAAVRLSRNQAGGFPACGGCAITGPDWRESRSGTRLDRSRMERRPSCGTQD